MRVGLQRLLDRLLEGPERLLGISPRRYFGGPSTSPCSHLPTVLRDNPVIRANSRSLFLPRLCSRRILPIMSMVILLHLQPVVDDSGRVGVSPGSVLGRHHRWKWLSFRSAPTHPGARGRGGHQPKAWRSFEREKIAGLQRLGCARVEHWE
jgi:hypothetical protein